MEPARTVRIRLDQDQARLLGLSSQQVALSLNAVVSGVTATQVHSGIYLVDVLVRASAEQHMSLSTSGHFRCLCRTARPFRSAKSQPSITARNIQLSGVVTGSLW